MEVKVNIRGYELIVDVGTYYPRIKGTRWEQEEPEYYELDEVTLISNPSLSYNEIDELIGCKDLFCEIQDEIIEMLKKC